MLDKVLSDAVVMNPHPNILWNILFWFSDYGLRFGADFRLFKR